MSSSDDPDHKKKRANVSIRQMEIDDIATIFHLGEQLFTAREVPNLYRTWDEYELISLFQSDAEFCLVAEVDDKLVGFASGTTITKSRSAWKYGYLVWLGVDPDYHGMGIAEKLFHHFRGYCLAQGLPLGYLLGDLAQNGGDIALQVAHSSFPCVVAYDLVNAIRQKFGWFF